MESPLDGEIFQSTLNPEEIIELCKKKPITHFQQVPPYEWGYELNDEEVELIAPHLCTSSLKHLDLRGHGAKEKGGLALAEHLKKCTSLTYLDLRANYIGYHASLEILNTLIDSNIPLVSLYIYQAGDCSPAVWSAYATLISKCPTLRELGIPYGGSGIETFYQALKGNTTLKTLHVKESPLHLVDDCFEQNSTVVNATGRDTAVARYAMINQLCQRLKANESERNSIPRHMDERDEIESFLQELIRTGEQWNAAKLIFLGNGEVGKTTLLNAILKVQEKIKYSNKWLYEKAIDWLYPARTIGIDLSTLIFKDGEISVWDFGGQLEYAVTHQFFLSDQMAVYIICFDLSQPADKQTKQIAYWLDFLQSALPPSTSSAAKSKWKVILVGTKLDMCGTAPSHNSFLSSWRATWSRLPIHNELFSISSKYLSGVDKLLHTLEDTFSAIFTKHTLRIPKSFKSLLNDLQSIPQQQAVQPISELFQHYSQGMNQNMFALAIAYLHAIGRVVKLQGDLICTAPKIIPDLAAKFISPDEVRMRVISDQVEILQEQQIGSVLTIHDDSNRMNKELKLLEHIKVCFRISGKKASWLFPSLASKLPKVNFFTSHGSHQHLASMRFTAPQGTIFIPGFFCQFIVAIFEKLNTSKNELLAVHSNCVSIGSCGVFSGELLVTIEDDSKSIVALVQAKNPDLSFVRDVFANLASSNAVQYQSSTIETLCPTCVDLSYFRGKFPHESIGIVEYPVSTTETTHNANELTLDEPDKPEEPKIYDFCKPRNHKIEELFFFDITLCWTHNKSRHDFFLNYRVATEGRKVQGSSENQLGLVEVVYHKLATTKKKDDQPLFIFWDKKCLNMGQNWEKGFLHGIKSSTVILLLVSHKVIEGIAKNAPKRQDNVLIEYECAILLNELYGTPVLPIFAAEMTDDGKCNRFEFSKASDILPDKPHARKDNAQATIDELSQSLPEPAKKLVRSIKNTVETIFTMNGVYLTKRGEDPQELNHLVDQAMQTLNRVHKVASPSSASKSL